MVRIIVTGAAGRLARVLCAELVSDGREVVALERAEMDICRADQITAVLDRVRPDVVINCAAYNAVDGAETNRAAAFASNGRGPALLAAAADAVGALFVQFSSDFVFDGESDAAYTEVHPTNPLNEYGRSKLAGEIAARCARRHYVVRVSSLFGGRGVKGHRATVDYIVDSLLAGTTVRAAVDRTVTPSYAPDVARAIAAMLRDHVPFGTYHCASTTPTTWYELAQEVARQLGTETRVEPAIAADLSAVAPRPRACALAGDKLTAHGILMPTWETAIRRHLAVRQASVMTLGDR
jgi:dTDP-4-dehydrorhamnose reductase